MASSHCCGRPDRMKIVGVTGGIGMGKSTVARMFARYNIPVFDADAVVREMQARNGAAIPAIAAAFPDVVHDGVLNRAALRARILGDPDARRLLEAIMHRMVRDAEKRFLTLARRHGARAAVLDIPLLFEARQKDKSRERVDLSVAVSAPLAEQIARVRRRGFAPLEIAKIIAVQMPDHEKRRLADVVIRTGLSRAETRRAVSRLVRKYL